MEDTAYVGLDVYVGPCAIVCDRAKVCGVVSLYDYAKVSGHAEIYGEGDAGVEISGHTVISGHAVISGYVDLQDDTWYEAPPQMEVGRWSGHMREVDVIAIGCETSPVDADLHAWVDTLARRHGATPAEILAARHFCAYVQEWRETFVEVEYVDGEGA